MVCGKHRQNLTILSKEIEQMLLRLQTSSGSQLIVIPIPIRSELRRCPHSHATFRIYTSAWLNMFGYSGVFAEVIHQHLSYSKSTTVKTFNREYHSNSLQIDPISSRVSSKVNIAYLLTQAKVIRIWMRFIDQTHPKMRKLKVGHEDRQ